MSRAFITVDETCPNIPVPELHVNGGTLRMSEREFTQLVEEAQWALGCIAGVRRSYWATLGKYVEVKNVA